MEKISLSKFCAAFALAVAMIWLAMFFGIIRF
jgi:hypothetical protein